ncbi:MAG TPA: regulatory protein RecX [Dehalococcoidia bacterium]|nr:regulatory protein RecX [Dehalococcoidia bacterium]
MPVITAIEKQKRRKRADVYLDGVLALSLRLDVIAMAHLAVGEDMEDRRRREIEAEDQRLGALESALRLLAMGPRTERDLRERLERRRGFRPEAVEAAVGRMRELGYLDDAAYARFYVESRQASPRSKRALTFELSRKGVDRTVTETALEEHDDVESAYEAARRRLRSLRDADRATFERRLGNFLASRGFGFGVARATIQRCWREIGRDGSDVDFAEGG